MTDAEVRRKMTQCQLPAMKVPPLHATSGFYEWDNLPLAGVGDPRRRHLQRRLRGSFQVHMLAFDRLRQPARHTCQPGGKIHRVLSFAVFCK